MATMRTATLTGPHDVRHDATIFPNQAR
jgi:hypothetical protein